MMARNLIPSLNSGIAPLSAMTGRSDIFAALEQVPQRPMVDERQNFLEDVETTVQRNIHELFNLRSELIVRDARQIVSTCDKRRLRAGTKYSYVQGENIDVFVPARKEWSGGFRFGAQAGSHAFVEKGNRIMKHPLCWIRPRNGNSTVTIPREEEEQSLPSSGSMDTGITTLRELYVGTVDSTTELMGEMLAESGVKRNPEYRTDKEQSVPTTEICLVDGEKNHPEPKEGRRNEWETDREEEYAQQAEEERLIGNADPSRLPPRIYLEIEGCVRAIEKELNGLTSADSRGVPALVAIPINKEEYRQLPIAHSVLIVKKKNPTTFKARLCVRGGELAGKTDFDTTSPTAARVSPRIVVLMAVISQWKIASVDISQAFLQSEMMAPHQRVRVRPPNCAPCPWFGKVEKPEGVKKSGWCFLTLRPLYGTTCAPLRWFNRLAQNFVKFGWVQTKTDPCVFRLEVRNVLAGVCIVHVDDILVTASSEGHKKFEETIRVFKHSGITILEDSKSLTYLGIEIEKKGEQYRFKQEEYANSRLQTINVDEIVRRGTFLISHERRKTAMKQAIGSLLWINLTRMDCSHRISRLASTTTCVIDDPKRFSEWITENNKVIDYIQKNVRYVNFASPLEWIPKSVQEASSVLQIFCFADASHASLPGKASMQCYTLLAGKIQSRNGDFLAKGCVIDASSRKIQRVCKSSLSAEVVSLGAALDITLWTKVLLIEMFEGRFAKEIMGTSDNYALQTPFDPAPPLCDVKLELKNLQNQSGIQPLELPPAEGDEATEKRDHEVEEGIRESQKNGKSVFGGICGNVRNVCVHGRCKCLHFGDEWIPQYN